MKYVLVLSLFLVGCAGKTEGRSLVCLGFCSEQAVRVDRRPDPPATIVDPLQE